MQKRKKKRAKGKERRETKQEGLERDTQWCPLTEVSLCRSSTQRTHTHTHTHTHTQTHTYIQTEQHRPKMQKRQTCLHTHINMHVNVSQPTPVKNIHTITLMCSLTQSYSAAVLIISRQNCAPHIHSNMGLFTHLSDIQSPSRNTFLHLH